MTDSAIYLDSGALVKLYVAERGSDEVQSVIEGCSSLRINSLQELEVTNAIRAAVGRGLLEAAAAEKALAFFDFDFRVGRLLRSESDWNVVWSRARQLSADHTVQTLCRTLDLLHVALAQTESAEVLVTGDKRQADVCHRTGLPVRFIETA